MHYNELSTLCVVLGVLMVGTFSLVNGCSTVDGRVLAPPTTHVRTYAMLAPPTPHLHTCIVLLNDVDQLVGLETDLVGVLSLVVCQHFVLFQTLHLVRMGDNGFQSCRQGGKWGRSRSCDRERNKGQVM